MRQTSLLNVALCAIALTASLPASAEIVNGETDARAFAVREGELRREQAAEDAAEQAQAQAAAAEPAKPETKADKRRAHAEEKAAKLAAARAAKLETSKTKKSAKAEKAETAEEPTAEAPQPEPQKPSGFLALFQPAEKTAPGLAEINTRPEGEAPAASAPGPAGLRAIVARHAAANGVPFSLADAVVKVESRYNPRAANRGNYGLMQIRHQTARGVGYDGSASGLLDAETNARYGMKYLAQAYKLANGDTCGTIMRYQNGHMSTRMTGANRTYCAKVRTITASN